MGDVTSSSTPLAMWMDGASGGWECVVDEKDRTDEGGEAGYALMLRVLAWNWRPGPGSGTDLGDSSWKPCLLVIFFSMAVRGVMQPEGLMGGLARPLTLRDDNDGVQGVSRFGEPERMLSMKPIDNT
jgi:hypothetical protein